jgi:type III secretion system FlhB-like substrate exporter
MTKTNGYANAQRFVDEYEKHELDKQQIMLAAAKKVAEGPGKFMKQVIELAKNEGVPVKVFRAVLLERKHLQNAAKVRDKLDEELVDELDVLRKSLAPVADLPIFGAALAAAEAGAPKKSKSEALVDDLTNDDDGDDAGEVEDDLEDSDDPRPRFLKQPAANDAVA